jgi:hypothetical protein
MQELKRLAAKLFRSKDRQIVLLQAPNAALATYIVAIIIGRFLPPGNWLQAERAVAYGVLFTWAWMEIFSGVNYFRRALGAVVLVTMVFGTLMTSSFVHRLL